MSQPPLPRWGDLVARLFLAGPGLILIVLLVVLGSPVALGLVAVLAAFGAGMEFRRLLTVVVWPTRVAAAGVAAGLSASVALLGPPLDGRGVLGAEFMILVSIATVFWLFEIFENRVRGDGGGAPSLLELFLLALVAGLLPAMLALIKRDGGAAGTTWTLLALAVSWGGDIGGYFVGRMIGRHLLAPRLSPRKTWEGVAGSVIAAGLCAGLVMILAPRPLPLTPAALVITVIVGNALAQCGDLAESWVKRRAGVRHSGLWGTGGGGWLDALDSVSFAAPFIYFVMRAVSAG